MNFTCNECNDTGSRDKSGDYLDCGHCDAAMQRAAMNDFLDNLPAMGDYDAAWLVHQRALAMAPKQEAPAQEPVGRVAKSPFGPHKALVLTVKLDDIPLGSKLYLAAPAAANGALTDEQILLHAVPVFGEQDDRNVRNDELIGFARAVLAAAGPDAALVNALEEVIVTDWPACNPGCDYEDPYGGMHDHRSKGCVCEEAKESIARQRAALSGAKGN